MELLYPPFRQWLVQQPLDAVVGFACRSDACPVATFLSVQFPNAGPFEVDPEFYSSTVRLPMPQWARGFVIRIDVCAEAEGSPITAQHALTLLGPEE